MQTNFMLTIAKKFVNEHFEEFAEDNDSSESISEAITQNVLGYFISNTSGGVFTSKIKFNGNDMVGDFAIVELDEEEYEFLTNFQHYVKVYVEELLSTTCGGNA